MTTFQDTEIIKLGLLAGAFIVGVAVCIYVALKETADLNRRRLAKKKLYEDAVYQELLRKKEQHERRIAEFEARELAEQERENQERLGMRQSPSQG